MADVIVFDPATILPEMQTLEYDLPAGARRLKQKSTDSLATIVNGEVLLRDNQNTGALPGRLLRGWLGCKDASEQQSDGLPKKEYVGILRVEQFVN